MKVIIMAAGVGKRMQPLTFEKPKPMLTVGGKPILEHIINSFGDVTDEIIIIVGYKAEAIKSYFGDSFQGKKITYIEQEKATGTAHAILLCKPLLKDGERFYVVNADDLHDKDAIEKCLEYDRAIVVCEAEHPERMGVVTLDKDNRVIELIEKPEHPKSNLVSNGVYLLDTNIFKYTPDQLKGEFFLPTMLAKMLKDFPIYAVQAGFWHPIGYPEDLKNANEKMEKGEIPVSVK